MARDQKQGEREQGHRTSRRCKGCNQWFKARGPRPYCSICTTRLRLGLLPHRPEG